MLDSLRRLRARSAFALVLLGSAVMLPAQGAVSIRILDHDAYLSASAGRSLALEDFEGFPSGRQPTDQIRLRHGLVYEGTDVSITIGDQALTGDILQPRVFRGFPRGTSLFACAFPLIQRQDEYDILIETVGGTTLFLDHERGARFRDDRFGPVGGFLAVQVEGDALARISFQATSGSGGPGAGGGGTGNYSFDDVTIDLVPTADLGGGCPGAAAPAVTPLPTLQSAGRIACPATLGACSGNALVLVGPPDPTPFTLPSALGCGTCTLMIVQAWDALPDPFTVPAGLPIGLQFSAQCGCVLGGCVGLSAAVRVTIGG